MKIPKELTTITPLSKYLAMVVFVALPIVGFFLGTRYQEMMNLAKHQEIESNLSIPRIPTPIIDETANWKTYTNREYGLEMRYPNNLSVSFSTNNGIVLEDTNNPNNGRFIIRLVNKKFEEAIKNISSKEIKTTQISERDTVYYFLVDHNQFNTYYKINVNTDQTLELQIISTEIGSLSLEEQSKNFDQILSTFRFSP